MSLKSRMSICLTTLLFLYHWQQAIAQGFPAPYIPLVTNGQRVEYTPPDPLFSGGVPPDLPRGFGVFEPILNRFEAELQEEYSWCGVTQRAAFEHPPCPTLYQVGLSTPLSNHSSFVKVNFLHEASFPKNIKPVAWYFFHNLLINGFVFLDHIPVYELNDAYFHQIVSHPQNNKLSRGIVSQDLDVRLYCVERDDEWAECYLIEYPSRDRGKEETYKPVKARIFMQAFYPKQNEGDVEKMVIPILNKNLQAYAQASTRE